MPDYAGEERAQHMMELSVSYDGYLTWIYMRGTHSWIDGKYGHTITLALVQQTLDDINRLAENARYNFVYRREVIPKIQEEIGEIQECIYFDNNPGMRGMANV